jgi:hypothetical protein
MTSNLGGKSCLLIAAEGLIKEKTLTKLVFDCRNDLIDAHI